MDLETLLSYQWGIMAPEFIVLGVATLLSLLDLFMGKGKDRKMLAWLGFAGVVIALLVAIGQLGHENAQILADTYRLDSFSKGFKLILLTGAALVLLMAASYEPKEGIADKGEFYYLLMTALLGAMMMASSADLITLFVGLELLSLSSYILAGLRKKNRKSNEAAMKYVINGGISTAITLFGISYIYGLTGSTNLFDIQEQMGNIFTSDMQFIASLAFLITFVGLSFKIASVPFQMWAPDVYEGAPTPVTAFLSVISKAAGFIIILRLFISTFVATPGLNNEPLLFTMQDYIGVLAGITMIVGNTIALRQRNVKRLLAFSSIAHAGYLLVPFTALSALMFDGIWFYLVAYMFMNLGAFAVLQVVSQQADSEDISIFSGLYKRSPYVAIAMTIFLLSLAGLPGTAGFIGKFNIFVGALGTNPAHYVLAGLLIATTVVSYFYYFGIMVQMFFRPAVDTTKVRLPIGISIVLILCVVGTVALGIFPGLALEPFYENLDFNDFFIRF